MNTALHYFDTLPLHPGPRPLESFTSYLTRIAEANGIPHLSGLNAFVGDYSYISKFNDYPLRSFEKLHILSATSEDELLKTTLYHVGKKFGRICQPRSLVSFFSCQIASSLRFCPLCLQEDLFYRLTWRFLIISGCPKHACRLLEHCSHCGCLVPILGYPLRVGFCPMCKRDLRTSVTNKLTEEEFQEALKISQEIIFLLSPHMLETTKTNLPQKLGQEYELLRNNKGMKRTDVCDELGMSISTLQGIELGKKRSGGVKLRSYFKYASYLGVPVSQIILNAVERNEDELRIRTTSGKYFLASEDWMLERVQEAIRELEISGKPFSIKAICNEIGILKTGLNKYDRVKSFLGSLVNHNKPDPRLQDPLFEEKLLEQAQQAIHELTQRGKPITHLAVSTYLDICQWEIILYPQVKQYIGQFVDYAQQQQKHAKQCEQTLLEKVRAGVMDLVEHHQPVTYNAISKKIGINHATWWPYAEVREFVEQHLDSRYLGILKEREKREEVLISRLEEAFSQLETTGKPVTYSSLARLVQVSRNMLMNSPRVQGFIVQRIGPPRVRGGQARRNEEEMMSDVQRTITLLIARNARVNYTSIAREIGGISAQTLRSYPKVRMIVDEYLRSDHLIQLHLFTQREEQLLNMVKDAITEIEALRKPITQCELLAKVGKNRTTLRSYPRVNAFIEQKITRHHVYQQRRKQPEEEELLQRVKDAIADLTECNEHITLTKVARKVHYSPNVLMQFPPVALVVEQNRYKRQERRIEREEELLNLTKDAIHIYRQNGYPITKESLSFIVGINRTTLYHYQLVRALMTEAANVDKQRRQERRFKKREEELFQQVVNAIQQLRDSGTRVSLQSVEKTVHVSFNCLRHYPMVKTLLKNTIAAQSVTHK